MGKFRQKSKDKPSIVTVPKMNFIAVRGSGGSDARKTTPEKQKTVIRHPIRQMS